MKRVALPTLLALAALAWGLVALERIFVQERVDAREALVGRQHAIEQYARAALADRLHRELESRTPRLEAAVTDPLVFAADLYLVRAGTQQLPRLPVLPASEGTAAALYDDLRAAHPISTDRDDPLRDRLALFEAVRTALQAGRRDRIEATTRALLAHRSLYRLPPAQDLPITLALLDALDAHSTPDPALVRALLVDGFEHGQARTDGLQRALLRHRAAFTPSELEYFAAELARLGSKAQVPDSPLHAALADPGQQLSLGAITEPTIVGGAWYAEPFEHEEIRGIRLELPSILAEVEAELRVHAALPDPGTRLHFAALAEHTPLAGLQPRVTSPSFVAAAKDADARFRLKTLLVVVVGLLVVAIVLLAAFAQAQRQRFVQLKSDFVATVSHELRTPLASIRLLAETLDRKLGDHPAARDYPARIVNEIERLTGLVENILSFNRLEKGRLVPRLADVSLADLSPAIAQEAAQCARGPIDLDASGLAEVHVRADPELVKLLFANLARNACLHNERTPIHIRVDASRGRDVVVRFADNGVGIPPTDQERVFGEFVRGRAAEASARRGSGLGLALCRRIMRAHGGDIRVAASGPDGTTFELHFPSA